MPLICPTCKNSSLKITNSLELGASRSFDEVSFQVIECNSCGLKGVAVYEENRWGSSEIVNHYGYIVSEAMFNKANNDINNKKVQKHSEYFGSSSRFNIVFRS